jgi:hypothetical protein
LPCSGLRCFSDADWSRYWGMQWFQKLDVLNEREITPWVETCKRAIFVRMEYCCAIAVLSDTNTSDVTWIQTLWRDYLTNSFVFLDVGHKKSGTNENSKNILFEIAAMNRGPKHAKFVPTVMNLVGNNLPLAWEYPQWASKKGYEILNDTRNTTPKNVYVGQDFLAMLYVLLHRTYFCPRNLGAALLKRFKDIGGLEPNLVSGQKVHLVYYPPSDEKDDGAPSRETRGHSWGLGQEGNDVLAFTDITRTRSHQIYPCVIEFSSASSSGSITNTEKCTFKTTDGDKPLMFDGVKLENVTLRSYVGGNTTSIESGFPVNLVLDPPYGSGVSVSKYAASTNVGGLRPAWIEQKEKADLGAELFCNWAIFRVDIGSAVNMTPKETPAPSALTLAPLTYPPTPSAPQPTDPSAPQPTDPPTPNASASASASASAPQPTDPPTQADTTLLAGFTEKLGVARLFGVSNDAAGKIVLCSIVAIFLIVAGIIIYAATRGRPSSTSSEIGDTFDEYDPAVPDL